MFARYPELQKNTPYLSLPLHGVILRRRGECVIGIISSQFKRLSEVNPVPRTYVRGFGALPLQGGWNIHPRAYARGVLWYGVKSGIEKGNSNSQDIEA